MIQVYKHNNGHLEDNISLASAEKGSWIHVVNPDSEDLQLVSMVTEIPTDVLKTSLDTEERSHVELEDNYIFIVINIPIILETDSYDTLPLGIFITPDFIITLCIQETEVMRTFTENKYPLFYTFKKRAFSSRFCTARRRSSCGICSRSTTGPMTSKKTCAIPCRTRNSSCCWNYRNH